MVVRQRLVEEAPEGAPQGPPQGSFQGASQGSLSPLEISEGFESTPESRRTILLKFGVMALLFVGALGGLVMLYLHLPGRAPLLQLLSMLLLPLLLLPRCGGVLAPGVC